MLNGLIYRFALAALVLGLFSISSPVAQDAPEFGTPRGDDSAPAADPRPTAEDRRVQQTVDNGLRRLAAMQNSDGSWANDVGNKLGHSYQRNADGYGRPHVGVTAICCMAFMAAGHTPDRGEYHRNVAAGLNFILSDQTMDRISGWISRHDTRMYSHAFASMFLAEVYGQTRDPVVLRHLRNAISFIVKAQNQQGAWRYSADQLDSDMSICVCQLQALRAAANVGVLVPKNAIEDAKNYVRKSYNHYRYPGSFKYQIDWDDRSTFALTSAGIVALQSLGEYDSHTYIGENGQAIKLDLNRSIQYLISSRPDKSPAYLTPGTRLCDYGFWYGHYYAAQAMYQYQFVSPRTWQEWNKQNRAHFMKLQHGNGAWTDEIGGWDPDKNAFATAMACLILSIPRGYLPIFQN